jgi:hypothetical protein
MKERSQHRLAVLPLDAPAPVCPQGSNDE